VADADAYERELLDAFDQRHVVVGDDAEEGQTQAPAEPGGVGVPPDEEMNQPDE